MSVEDLTGWLDYDRDKLPSLNFAERVNYFENRVRRLALNPLRRILATEISPTPDSSALLVFGVSMCCAIEAMGKFLTGGRVGNSDRFLQFVHRYMSPEFQTASFDRTPNVQLVWEDFRNGLAHGFAVQHGGFEGETSDPLFKKVTICGRSCLELNPTRFLEDFSAGVGRYLVDLRASPNVDLRRNFDLVFENVFIKGK